MDRSAVGPMESAQDKAPLPGKPSRIGHGGPRRGVLGSRVTEGPKTEMPRGEGTELTLATPPGARGLCGLHRLSRFSLASPFSRRRNRDQRC